MHYFCLAVLWVVVAQKTATKNTVYSLKSLYNRKRCTERMTVREGWRGGVKGDHEERNREEG